MITGHLIEAPVGWWETYDPLVEAWEAQQRLRNPRKRMAARIAAYFLLDAPLVRKRWSQPDPERPVFSWEGLDAEELIFGVVAQEHPGAWQEPDLLRYLRDFVDYLGVLGAIPKDVWTRILDDYDAQADRLRDIWLAELDAFSAEEQLPYRRAPKVGRNQPCPCSSGRKYKRCCGAN